MSNTPLSLRRFSLVAAAACLALAGSLSAAADDGVRLLTGFERADALKWGYTQQEDVLVTAAAVEKKKIGWIKGAFPRGIRRGDATEGQWACYRTFSQRSVGFYLKSGRSEECVLHMQGNFYNTHGFFRKVFPTDWTGYDRLRIDVKSTDAAARVELMLEDELISPALVRTYRLPAGKWVAVEFDLAEAGRVREAKPADKAGPAVRGRLLNPAKMANLRLQVDQTDAGTTVLLDNVRLLKPGAKDPSALEVLTDTSAFPTPAQLPAGAGPRKPPDRPDRRADAPVGPAKVAKALLTRVGSYGMMSLPRGVAVGDGEHVLFVGSIGRMQAAQTADGGRRWTDLTGKPNASTNCQHSCNAPGNTAYGAGADGLLFYTARCSGGGGLSDIYFRRAAFGGAGWTLSDPVMVDLDVRHCPEHLVRAVRLPNGRIWVAWLHADRFGGHYLRARYSDDRGRIWRTLDSNVLETVHRRRDPAPLTVASSWWQQSPTGWKAPPGGRSGAIPGRFHPHGRFCLVPYRGGLACVYAQGDRDTAWTHLDADAKAWSDPAILTRSFGGPHTAVTVGDKTIYTSLMRAPKILRLEGAKWVEDTPPEYAGRGVLSAAGDAVYCFWLQAADGKTAIRVSHKPPAAAWSAPRTLSEETEKIQGISAPMYAPAKFIPVFWGPKKGWVKFVRLAVADPPAE